MAAVVMVYLLVYRPIIQMMDATIKRSRSMLLLFPGEVVQCEDTIRRAMEAYANGAVGAQAGLLYTTDAADHPTRVGPLGLSYLGHLTIHNIAYLD